MTKEIIIALAREGNTDELFLKSVIKRTFEQVACECQQEIEIFDPVCLKPIPGNIKEKALRYATKAAKGGATILCLHADADARTDDQAFNDRINPAFQAILKQENSQDICQNLVPIVPIQMTEAWMLADKELLKKELGTAKHDTELGINKKPEDISKPKDVIKKAIQIARKDLTKRRRSKLTISELYSPIGQKIELIKLQSLPSYEKFENAVRDVFKKLSYF